MRALDDWDEAYVQDEIQPSTECAWLEKKSSAKLIAEGASKPGNSSKDELAKQVSAFSNSGQGFLVYGIHDKGNLDNGVPQTIGKQKVTEWVEAMIPSLVYPPVTECATKLIAMPNHHSQDRALLVVSVPLSERRPHWVVGSDVAYIRAGSHSLPMRLQTALDMASRGTASQVEIECVRAIEMKTAQSGCNSFRLRPMVRLVSGPICRVWAFEMKVISGNARFIPATPKMKLYDAEHIYLLGESSLFPGRSTPVTDDAVALQMSAAGDLEITATIYAESAQPVRRSFSTTDIYPLGK